MPESLLLLKITVLGKHVLHCYLGSMSEYKFIGLYISQFLSRFGRFFANYYTGKGLGKCVLLVNEKWKWVGLLYFKAQLQQAIAVS